MKMLLLTLATAIGAMQLLAGGAANMTQLATLGIGDGDFRLLTGNEPWTGQDRSRVVRTFEAIVYGAMDIAGVQRTPASAEYIAAAMVMFVQPINIMLATRWIAEHKKAEDIIGNTAETESVKPEVLFALCATLMYDKTAKAIKARFDKKQEHAEQQNKKA